MYCVYMHTTPSNKRYIGITQQTPEKRWQKGHGYDYGSNDYFYNAIKKYGWGNIKHEILFDNIEKEDAERLEIDLIAKYKTTNPNYGYNHETGGMAFEKHTEEYKQRMSKLQKQIWANSPERRKRMSEMAKGRVVSEHQKELLRKANLGKKLSKQTIAKISEKNRGKEKPKTSIALKRAWSSGKMRGMTGHKGSELQKEFARRIAKVGAEAAQKPIVQISKNGEFIAEYKSAADATRKLGLNYAHISDVCKGKRKSTLGYYFRYKEKEE